MAQANPFGWQVENSSGTPVSGAKIYFYIPGTTTPRTTYTDSALTVPAANPVVADSAGWFGTYTNGSLAYDVLVKSADDSITYRTLTIPAGTEIDDPTLVAIGGLVLAEGDHIEATGADTVRARKMQRQTYAALTAIGASARFDDMRVSVASRSTDGDGGEGEWRFDAASSASANGGTILAPDAGTGRWLRQYSGAVNVRWFGAKGDNSTDDVAAFNAAGALNMVYVPAGTYVLSAEWLITGKSVFIFGDGRANTVLKFSGTARGIYVDNSGVFAAVDIYDIGIKTTATSPTGTAIVIVWPDTFDGRQIHKGVIANCQIEGSTNTTMGWAKGISYTRGNGVTIRDCGILGKDTNGSSSTNIQTDKTVSSIAIEYLGSSGAYPTEIRVVGCYISCWDTALDSPGSGEGIYVNNSVMINVRVGVDCEPPLATRYRPLLNIADTHIAAFQYAIYALGMIQSYIHDNLLYFADGGNQDGEILHLEEGGGVHIHNNGFYSFGTTYDCTGITVQNTGTTIANVIDRNSFGTMDKGIWLKSTSGRTWLKGNIAEGTYASGFIDNDTSSAIIGQRGCLAYLNAASQAIADSTVTKINWDTQEYDTDGFFAPTSNSFIIPAGFTGLKARLSTRVTWEGNTTGNRTVTILKNNNILYPGCSPNAISEADGTETLGMAAQTGIIILVDGDDFEVQVEQKSGGSLNVLGAQRMWFQLEIIE